MGLVWIVTMHDPISVSDGGPILLGADRHGDGSWLCTYWGYPDCEWSRKHGFAFVVSQVTQS